MHITIKRFKLCKSEGCLKNWRLYFLFPILLLALTWPVLAAEAGDVSSDEFSKKVSWNELLKTARERNPDIRAAQAEREAAKKKIPQSWALSDPMAGLDVMGGMTETRTGPEKNRFMVSQSIPFPTKLYEKWKSSKEEARKAEALYQAEVRSVLRDVKQTYFALYETEASLQVLGEIQDVLKKAEGVAEAKYANQSGSQRDAAKAQAEFSMMLETIYRLESDRVTLSAFLNELLDRSPLLEFGAFEKPQTPQLTQNLLELFSQAEKFRQEIQAGESELAKSRHQKRLAWMEYLPDLDASFVYTQVGGGTTMEENDGKDSWMFPLRFNVPLWQNRIVPMIQQAGAEVRVAESKLQGTKNKTFYEVKEAYTKYQTGSKISLLYETAVIPQAKLALSSDQAGYEAGKVDFLEFLDSQRVYLNAQLGYLKVYTETLRSFADLERAVGRDLEKERI